MAYRTDDPVLDALRDAEDGRPVKGRCITCGEIIHDGDDRYAGDDYWRVYGWIYCADCGLDRIKEEFFVSGR